MRIPPGDRRRFPDRRFTDLCEHSELRQHVGQRPISLEREVRLDLTRYDASHECAGRGMGHDVRNDAEDAFDVDGLDVFLNVGNLRHHHVIDDLSGDLPHEFAPFSALQPISQCVAEDLGGAVAEVTGRGLDAFLDLGADSSHHGTSSVGYFLRAFLHRSREASRDPSHAAPDRGGGPGCGAHPRKRNREARAEIQEELNPDWREQLSNERGIHEPFRPGRAG